MRARTLPKAAGFLAALLASAAIVPWQEAAAQARARNARKLRVPPLPVGDTLPPLPERSARNANYTIEARLFPDTRTIEGTLWLEWTNLGATAVRDFPFHLYWNASPDPHSPPSGYTRVRAARLLGNVEVDLTDRLRYPQADGRDADERTLVELRLPTAVGPGKSARFRIDWTSRIPRGDLGPAGFRNDSVFVTQWFPKVGVLGDGRWSAHQAHPASRSFADYGVYDVRLTLPRGHVVGATGRLLARTDNQDGSETFRFVQEDVHDFAWAASRRFLERKARFEDPGYPPVEIRLLLQPEHAQLAERYLEATRTCLRSYGSWTAPYPYTQLTVVDPAWGSASLGSSYPTLFAGGSDVFAPRMFESLEDVAIRACGQQFFQGILGANELEEAWLGEGLNLYAARKASFIALGAEQAGRRYFGPHGTSALGIPVLAPEAVFARGEDLVPELRRHGQADRMALRACEYGTPDSYRVNTGAKPVLSLMLLEGFVGDDAMTRILRTYSRRFRFGHPTSLDFARVVTEVTGEDHQWLFDESWHSSGLCDYAVAVRNVKRPAREGFAFRDDGSPTLAGRERAPDDAAGAWESEVSVLRQGAVRLPLDLLVEFEDGQTATERWDGQYRWARFVYPKKVRSAVVDPGGKIALDVHPTNNTWQDDDGLSRRQATKWAARFLFWLQGLLELHMLVG